jgi:hypothetical protein
MVFVPLERHPRLKANPNLRDDRTVDWCESTAGSIRVWTSRRRMRWYRPRLRVWPSVSRLERIQGGDVEPYTSMGAAGRPESRRVISVLLSLAGTVLLIVCLNISA